MGFIYVLNTTLDGYAYGSLFVPKNTEKVISSVSKNSSSESCLGEGDNLKSRFRNCGILPLQLDKTLPLQQVCVIHISRAANNNNAQRISDSILE